MAPWSFLSMSAEQGTISALCHCLFQGILVALIPSALSNSGQQDLWLTRGYIAGVNSLALAQTIVSGTSVLRNHRPSVPPLVPPTLTTLHAMAVQSFYIVRCWRILGRRWLWITPYLVLWLAAAGSGFSIAALFSRSLRITDIGNKQKITLGVWVFSSFAVDLLMTCTTVIYIFRSHKGTSEAHNGVFTTVWDVIWTAAAPPLVVMFIVMVDGYLIPGTDHGWAAFFTDLSGKVYALSLMVTLIGRGYIRQRLSEANVGRASSGTSATRGITHSTHVFRDPTGQAPNEGVPHGAVSVQLDDLARVKAATNQNDSDGELDGSQRSKVGYVVEYHLSGNV